MGEGGRWTVYAATLGLIVSGLGCLGCVMGLRVRVLYTGDPYPGVTPYLYMKVEPLLQVTPVQASRDHYAGISAQDIRRAIRQYMPRTYQSLLESYDVIIISDANVGSFTREQHGWFRKGVAEEGLGLVMVGGHETFGGHIAHPDWGVTPVGEVLPVETIAQQIGEGRVTIVDEDHPFMRSLPWRPDLQFLQRYGCNIVKLRDGAKLLAIDTIETGFYPGWAGWKNPFFSTWDYGEGRTFAMTGDWTPGWGAIFLEWDYLPDFVTNLMLFVAKEPIPQDPELVHTIRSRITALGYQRLIVASLIDFVEDFGANPERLLLAAEEIDEAQGQVTTLYLEQKFQEALEATEAAFTAVDRAESVAERVKSEALFWVYLSEWLAVTATFLVCGFLLWSLMVRRRLYREVSTTRLGEA